MRPAVSAAVFLIVMCLVAPARVRGDEPAGEAGFTPLFNGRDLSGWVPVNVAPTTFTVRDNTIISTGVPTGVMRTDKQYENYVLELEWMHVKPGGNAGLFVWSDPVTSVGVPFTRAIEIQILDGPDTEDYTCNGDVFSIHGAKMKPDRPHPHGWERCLPSEKRSKPAGQWNHYRVECNDGSIKLAVNGKVVSGATQAHPRKGYICLESEGGECHFRNIRIKELPSTNPKPDEVAPLDEGFKSIYTGLDLTGWKADAGQKDHWKAKDWTLVHDGKAAASEKPLWTEKEYGDFELIVDWRLTDKNAPADNATPPAALYVRGSAKQLTCLGGAQDGASAPAGDAALAKAGRKSGEWNRLVLTVRGGDVSAVLNGQAVAEKVHVDLPPRGPVGLLGGGRAIEFANLYVRELK
jgi:hypothetical protein